MINVPTLSQRKQILTHQCSRLRVDSGLDLDIIAQMTNGYVGADLMSLCHEAAFTALGSIQPDLEENKVLIKLLTFTCNKQLIMDLSLHTSLHLFLGHRASIDNNRPFQNSPKKGVTLYPERLSLHHRV